jgi:hypothetical protein
MSRASTTTTILQINAARIEVIRPEKERSTRPNPTAKKRVGKNAAMHNAFEN